jgi:hypothetical protein
MGGEMSWHCSEPSLDELFEDPILDLLLRSDRVNKEEFQEWLQQMSKGLMQQVANTE